MSTASTKRLFAPKKPTPASTKPAIPIKKPLMLENRPLVPKAQQTSKVPVNKPLSLQKTSNKSILREKPIKDIKTTIKSTGKTESEIVASDLPVPIKVKRESRFKPLHQLYTRKHWKTIEIRRIHVKQFLDVDKRAPRQFYRSLSTKSLRSLYNDLSIPVKQQKKCPKKTLKCPSLVKKVDLDISSGGDHKIYLHGEYMALKRLKGVTSCSLNLYTLKDFKLLVRLAKRWRYLDNLTIICSNKWTHGYWRYLESTLNPRIRSLNLEINLDSDSCKGLGLEKCAQKIQKMALDAIKLSLEVESEYIINYFLAQCGYFKSVKILDLQCVGARYLCGLNIMAQEFNTFANNIIPTTLHHTNKLQKLRLDLSNGMVNSYRINNSQLRTLCETMTKLQDLVELDLNLSNLSMKSNFINDEGLSCIGETLRRLNTIQLLSLRMENNGVTEKGVVNFFNLISVVSSLKEVRIGVTENGIKYGTLEDAIFEFKKHTKALCKVIY